MLRLTNFLLLNTIPQSRIVVPCAGMGSKHWKPEFKRLRTAKVIKVNLPDFYKEEKDLTELTPDEIRSKMKERGIQPKPQWQERSFTIACTTDVFEPYIPPEGDGKMSILSIGGAKQVAEKFITKKSKSYMTVRKIRSYDEDFEPPIFVQQAEQIYKDLHIAMSQIPADRHHIRTLVTERAYPEVMGNLRQKVIKWQFLESIEPPRMVHGRQTYLVNKDNVFAQLTVRFHTKQVLVVYDRFGRICHGNPVTAKDVLEYVVFEKHLADEYGIWRIHAKIIPEWLKIPPQETRTIRLLDEQEPPPPPPSKKIEPPTESQVTTAIDSTSKSSQSTPQIATA